MKLGKWTYELVVVAVLLIVGGSIWGGFVATKETRAAKTEIENMIKYAQRQALEIAIIEQSSKLADYRRQLAAQRPKPAPPAMNPFAPVPLNPIPIVADPKDVDLEK